MPHPSRISVCVLGVWLCGVCSRSAGAADDFVFYHENVMGTSLELGVRADDAEAARRAEGRVLREIDRLAAIFSGYDPASEFRRWQATSRSPTKVSPELFEVLQASDRWRDESGGAFDPRVQALTRLWSRCAAQGRTPTAEELAGAKALMGRPAWRLDPAARTAERLSDCPLSLDAIAKGYIVERACEAALERGPGRPRPAAERRRRPARRRRRRPDDRDRPPSGDSETAEPLAYVEVRDRAVATSGNSQRGFRIDGRWYSHIFDPRTGHPAERDRRRRRSIAERAADADALATILNVLPLEEGLRLVDSLPGVECLHRRGRRAGRAERRLAPLRAAATRAPRPRPGTPRRRRQRQADPGEAPAPWGDEFELLVNFEINRPDAERGSLSPPVRGRLGRGQGRVPGPDLGALALVRGAGPVPVAPRPEALVSRATRPAGASTRPNLIARSRGRPARPASTRSSGTARTTTASRSAAASTPSSSRPRGSTGRIRASASR